MVVGIAGLGVIGTSIGLALRARDACSEVLGYDVSPAHASDAKRLDAVDRVVDGIPRLLAADVIFLAVPPIPLRAVLEDLAAQGPTSSVATDCTSVKGPIRDWIQADPDRRRWLVGGHPMAGREASGPLSASASMFEGAWWVLTPEEGQGPQTAVVESVVQAIGGRPIRMSAEAHDRHAAALSHVPHVLASALAILASKLDHPDIGGGSWRDLTRVAGSNPPLWNQILLLNRDAVLEGLDNLEATVREFRRVIEGNDGDALRALIEESRQAKLRQERSA